ncbi:MAG: MBOAT family protein [bacterium]|nr:MBOAT family protein [bacterium]
MLFYTADFFIFFTAVLVLYFLTPGKYRWVPLLAASCYFYMCWEPVYVLFLLGAILVDYYCGLRIKKSEIPKEKRYYFLLSLFSNLGMLLGFKYLDFFNASLKSLLHPFNILYDAPVLNIAAPVGISYFTFKKLSYMIDIYRENREPEKHLGKFALYVSFFPAITAGPIDRADTLPAQFNKVYSFDYSRVTGGLKLMAWGMFKKVVIADRLAVFVNIVYNNPHDHQGLTLVIATLFFSIQIYADFSGYTDMAIGMARVMGFNLTDNFNRPYFAVSITEFWRRWHISLTTWLRDYLFLPIAYAVSRKIKKDRLIKIKAESWAYAVGILFTMLICGLWHGAAWTFFIWGGLHGLYLLLSFSTRKHRRKWRKRILGSNRFLKTLHKGGRILFTFCCVSFLWIFFRAGSLADAFYIVSHLFDAGQTFAAVFLANGLEFSIALAGVGFMLLVHLLQPHEGIREMFTKKPWIFRWIIYVLLVIAIMNLGKFNEIPFIYAQF